jgi:hypothetical protein
MYLLRLVPGSLPGGCHCVRPKFRIRDRDARGTLLRQGTSARERRSLGAGNCQKSDPRRAVSMRAEIR